VEVTHNSTEIPLDGVGELALCRSYPRLTALDEPTPLESPGLGQMISQERCFKAYGLNQLSETIDNTGIYKLMYETLFDTEIPDQGARNVTNASNGQNTFEFTPWQRHICYQKFWWVAGTQPTAVDLQK